jgi:hypothetical protein
MIDMEDGIEMKNPMNNNKEFGSKSSPRSNTPDGIVSSPKSKRKSFFRSNSSASSPKSEKDNEPASSLGAMTNTINDIKEMSTDLQKKTTAQQLSDELNERPEMDFLFSDTDQWKQIWNIFIMLLVMYTIVIIPLNFAFPDLPESAAIDYTIDVLFILDVIFTFRTAYPDANGDEIWDLDVSASECAAKC